MDPVADILKSLTTREGILFLLIMIAFGDRIFTLLDRVRSALFTKKVNTNTKIKDFYQLNKKIKEVLSLYLEEFTAAKIAFCVFHNGEHDVAGIPFLKFSVVEEALVKGMAHNLKLKQAIPLHIIIGWLERLLDDQIVIEHTEDCDNLSTKTFLEDLGVDTILTCPVWSNQNIVGFVAVEWTHRKYVPEHPEHLEIQVKQLAKLIEIERHNSNIIK